MEGEVIHVIIKTMRALQLTSMKQKVLISLLQVQVPSQCEMRARTLAPGNERVEVVRRGARGICERSPGVNVDAN